MQLSTRPLLALPLLALGLFACQAVDDEAEFRSYTTANTLSGGDDGGPVCDPDAPLDVDPRRSLFETHHVALAPFDMPTVLEKIAVNSGLVPNPGLNHAQFIDTYNTAPGLGLGQHCDDDVDFAGNPGINGYPLECPRVEGNQLGNLKEWFPIAAVNRFDLAPSDGSNCGEARLVMANNAQGRMFTIFEARIPNPNPECGLDACIPVQEFWAQLTAIDDPAVRAEQLKLAYLEGHPDLLAAGFPPFINEAAFDIKTGGQIRTNNFDQGPWTLREFKTVAVNGYGGPEYRMLEVPVAANPFGELWNDTTSLPNSAACQAALVGTVQHLMSNNPNLMAVDVPPECLAAESPDDSVMDYPSQLLSGSGGPSSLQAAIQAQILALDPGSALTPEHIARRAQFGGGCIGCHQQTNGGDLGNGVVGPSSLGFVHTLEFSIFEDCGNGDVSCFIISDALKDTFLPHREKVLESYLAQGPCCEAQDGGTGQKGGGAFDVLPIAQVDPIEAEAVDAAALFEEEAAMVEVKPSVAGSISKRVH